jgi:hypothetical protein
VPRLAPYEHTFTDEIGLRAADRVLCTAGPEVVALARAVGDGGIVHATDASDEVRYVCQERVNAAGVASRVEVRAVPGDAPYDVVASVFADVDLAWMRARIAPRGKVAVMLWGPAEEGDPERVFAKTIDEVEPSIGALSVTASPLDRASLARRFGDAGLVIVRHTVVAHALVFQRAEQLAIALLGARSYGRRMVELGEERVAALLSRFYARVASQDAPITYSPAATIVIAALPGAEVELPHRPSVRVPAVKPS